MAALSALSRVSVADALVERRGEEAALHARFLNPQFVRVLRTIGFDRTWAGADGAYLIDAAGDRYLDMLGGYGIFAVGRNNRRVRSELERVLASETANLPQMGVTVLAGMLAEQLVERTPDRLGAVLLTNSGTESVEAALKFARAATRRARIVYCDHAFHGLTLGALSINGNDEFRDRFGPLLPGCDPVPFGDAAALERELGRGDVAAFVVEPIQGKGVHLPGVTYLREAQELCRRHGSLFVCDEVQTGLARTGRFLALEHWGLEPDVVTLSKALSGGYVPVGAVLASRSVFDRVFDSMERSVVHGSTFGTNDLAAAAGLATLAELDATNLAEHAARAGEKLLELTRPLVDRYEVVREVRGLGLMWAIEFQQPSGAAARRVWRLVEGRQPGMFAQLVAVSLFKDHRILAQVAGHRMNVLKATPPLVLTDDDIAGFAAALDSILARAERLPRAMGRFALSMARGSLRRNGAPASNGAVTGASKLPA
jgi:ornithine--oxo-acid transaminase